MTQVTAASQSGKDNSLEKLPSELLSAELLRPLVLSTLRAAIYQYEQLCPADQGDLKLTILTYGHEDQAKICAHVSPLPSRPKAPVKIQVWAINHVLSSTILFPGTDD
jgi:hypothetical protein